MGRLTGRRENGGRGERDGVKGERNGKVDEGDRERGMTEGGNGRETEKGE